MTLRYRKVRHGLAQGQSHEKNPEDPVRLEPRTPGLPVKHVKTKPRKHLEKKVRKTFRSLKFTNSNARNFVKNLWSVTKLKLNL